MIRVRVRGRNPTPGNQQNSPFALDVLELADILAANVPNSRIIGDNSEQIPGFFWSPDGKKLLVARWHEESDVVLLRDTSK